MAKVITTNDPSFVAFTAATQHAQSRAQAAEAERAATEAARLALPTQVQAITGPAVQAAQSAASLAVQRAGVVGSVPNDAALAGRAAGDYRVGMEIVTWNGNAITARTTVLASDTAVQEARALADTALVALGNLTLVALNARGQVDGPQLVDGSRWIWQPTGTLNGGTVVTAADGGVWVREYSGPVDARWFGVVASSQAAPVNTGPALAAWAASLPDGAHAYLPPGEYATDRRVTFLADSLTLDMPGLIFPVGTYDDWLVNIEGGQASARFGDRASGNEWQKTIRIREMHLMGRYQSRGLRLYARDAFVVQGVHIECTNGAAFRMSKCREGGVYNLRLTHCDARRDLAVCELLDDNPGDANNTVKFWGLEVVWSAGRYIYADTPLELDPGSGPGSAFRMFDFYGTHIEDIGAAGIEFGAAGRLYPDPTLDRVWIRTGRGVRFHGGLFNAGRITTGSIFRFGDEPSGGRGMRVEEVEVSGEMFCYDGDGFAVKLSNAGDVVVDARCWPYNIIRTLWTHPGRTGAVDFRAAPKSATNPLFCLGNSQTEGDGTPGRADSYPRQLADLSGRQVINAGISAQRSDEIAARWGAVPVQFTVAGGSIPASGAVGLSLLSGPDLLVSDRAQSVTGRLGGVRGVLSRAGGARSATASYTFTRAAAGAAVAVASAAFVPDARSAGRTALLWIDRNNVTETASIMDHYAALTARTGGAFVVLGPLPAQDEGPGGASAGQMPYVTELRAQLANVYGDQYLDVVLVLCVEADGVTPRATPNPIWMADNLHPNAAGYARIAAAVFERLKMLRL